MAEHIDPICGMTVGDDSPRRFEFDGTTYFFCSDHCLKKFSADPHKYVHKHESALTQKTRCSGERLIQGINMVKRLNKKNSVEGRVVDAKNIRLFRGKPQRPREGDWRP